MFSTLMALVFLASLIALILGLIRPNLVIRWGTVRTRGMAAKVFGAIAVASLVLGVATAPPSDVTRQQEMAATAQQAEEGKPTEPKPAEGTPHKVAEQTEVVNTTADEGMPKTKEEPTHQKSGGLGISRDAVAKVFTQPEIGFALEESTPVDGKPRIMGLSPDQLAILELIGEPEALDHVNLMVTVPADRPDLAMLNLVYLLGVVKTVLPDWQEGPDWVTEAVEQLPTKSEVKTVYGHATVELTSIKELGLICLSIKPNE